MKGIEPPTPSLPWTCSTPELHRHTLILYKVTPLFSISYARSGIDKKMERVKRLEPSTLSLEG